MKRMQRYRGNSNAASSRRQIRGYCTCHRNSEGYDQVVDGVITKQMRWDEENPFQAALYATGRISYYGISEFANPLYRGGGNVTIGLYNDATGSSIGDFSLRNISDPTMDAGFYLAKAHFGLVDVQSDAIGLGSKFLDAGTSYGSSFSADYSNYGLVGALSLRTDDIGTTTGFIGSFAVGGEFTLGGKYNRVDQLDVAAERGAGRGVYFFDKEALPYINKPGATLGRSSDSHFFMPLEDSLVVKDAGSAYRYTGGAPSVERAYVNRSSVYGVEFPLNGLSPRLPTAADTTLPHFLEGGNTALRLPNGGGYLVNPTREFVVPGGGAMPQGSTLFVIGPNGTRIPIRGR